jgi:hypothetical protein
LLLVVVLAVALVLLRLVDQVAVLLVAVELLAQ